MPCVCILACGWVWFHFVLLCLQVWLFSTFSFCVCFHFAGEEEENLGSWKSELTQVAPAPGPKGEDVLILAANRTNRPDILRGFRRYRGGWDIADQHYWAVSATVTSLTIVF